VSCEDFAANGHSFPPSPPKQPRKLVRGKRLFDIVVSAAGLVLLAPFLGVIWITVRLTSRGPAIYKGYRVGMGGRDFEILKFRTMWNQPTKQLTTALDDPRITPIGRRLRRYKLDELPQLVNVLRGEMSIVGPRPEFRSWIELYTARQLAILSVRPGITDFASVEFIDLDAVVGSSDADERYLTEAFVRKNDLRLRYVGEMSWSTDLQVIARTLARLSKRS
jgi:lipopolysaccharide/colanic/teichoic acid biosynthesis glycosyltransferase